MSQFQPALSYTLNWEDPKREYRSVPDKGGFAVAGINSVKWPNDFKRIIEVSLNQRSQLVYDFYQKNFWNLMKIGGLLSQSLANRVFDMGVNASAMTSIRLLQRAIKIYGKNIVDDGIFGPITMEAANSIDSERLLAAFRTQRFHYYKEIVDEHPEDSIYLDGWEKRALA